MKDKTDQIVEAATTVFVNKGFIQATTQEIAKEANVAEVTLFRKFQTKQNLFEFIVKKVLEDKFITQIQEYATIEDTNEFLNQILQNRLSVISKNIDLVQLLITESLMKNLPQEMNFTNIIFEHLQNAVLKHFNQKNMIVDSHFIAKQCLSILLGHAILPHDIPFYKLSTKEQEKLIHQYAKSIVVNL